MFKSAIIHTGTLALSFVCGVAIVKIAYDATQLLNRRRQLLEIEETKAIVLMQTMKMKMNAKYPPSYVFSLYYIC